MLLACFQALDFAQARCAETIAKNSKNGALMIDEAC